MMTIIFVRHGESESNVAKIQTNENDKYHLTARGRIQVDRLTRELASLQPNTIYCSPVLRAVETAEIISRGLGIPVHLSSSLKERDWGKANGMKVQDFEAEVNLLQAADQFGIETILNITRRVNKFMEEVNPGLSVAVTHADIIRGALVYPLGLDEAEFSSYGIVPENATMTMLKNREGRFEVVSIGSPRATESMLKAVEGQS